MKHALNIVAGLAVADDHAGLWRFIQYRRARGAPAPIRERCCFRLAVDVADKPGSGLQAGLLDSGALVVPA